MIDRPTNTKIFPDMLNFRKPLNCGISSLFKPIGTSTKQVSRLNEVSKGLGPIFSRDELRDLVTPISSDICDSPWITQNFPRESILWPNDSLEAVRSAPMHPAVRDRMVNLWSTSSSHGVSWDELDEAFLSFHREYVQKENEWTEKYASVWDREYAESERVLRASLKGDEAQINTILHRRRGKIRRMTHARLSRMRFKEVVKPFHIRQFTDYMRAFVTQRIIKRENVERANHSPSP